MTVPRSFSTPFSHFTTSFLVSLLTEPVSFIATYRFVCFRSHCVAAWDIYAESRGLWPAVAIEWRLLKETLVGRPGH